jgi:hypothetical protein
LFDRNCTRGIGPCRLNFCTETSNQACGMSAHVLEQKRNKALVDKADKPRAGAARSAPMR